MNCYVPRRSTIEVDIVVQIARADVERMVKLFEIATAGR
jgi:hypothetical protein